MKKFRIPTPQDLIKGLRGFFSVGYMDNARENIIAVTPENPLPVEVSGGINISNLTNVDWESTWFEDLDAWGNRLALFERRTKLVDGLYTVSTHNLAGANYVVAGASQRVVGDPQAILTRLGQNLLTVEQAHTITDNTVTIANGQSTSGAINLAGLTVIRISMPSAWTTANLTVQTSRDNVTYQDLFDQYGSPFTIAAGASRNINLNPADLLGLRWIRLVSATVSGTTITPVNQAASRDINIVATNV